MSVEAMATVLHHSAATGTAKVVLIGIANHAGDGGAWPTIATLSKYAGVSERNVQVALRKLEELGEIRIHLQAGGTRQTPDRYRSNRYDILVACPADCDRSVHHRCASDDPTEPASDVDLPAPDPTSDRGVESDTPHAETGVMGSTPLNPVRGVDIDASGVSPATPEPSYNHPETPQPPDTTASPPTLTPICSRHPDGNGTNCRACGTTSRQLAERRGRDAEAARRAATAQEFAAARAAKEAARAALQNDEATRAAIAAAKAAAADAKRRPA